MAICYEVVFPAEVAALVRQGATLLVTITNDAWYGDTSAPWQHFRAARFRAAENRRPLLRAAITGVSAWVAPDGSVREQLGVDQEGIIRARVLGARGLTPFSRCPWLVPFALRPSSPERRLGYISSASKEQIMIAYETQQKIDSLSEQLSNLRGYL